MAITKVSALTAKTTPTGSEEVLINDGGTSKKITIANLTKGHDLPTVPSGITTDTNKEYNLKLTDVSGTETLTWIEETDNDTTYSTATATTEGLVKIEDDTTQTVAANTVSTTASRTYGVQLNSSDQAVVNVPWSDTDTNTNQLTTFTVSATTDTTPTTISHGDDLLFTAGTGITCETTADGTVTITNTVTDTDTTYSTATTSTEGLVKIEDGATQTEAANTVTATASRTYGVQLNASDQAVVNVPWTDTDTGITDVVDDTTPQLGGNLDFQTHKATSFTSTGIDDNATSTAITIDASENVTLTGTVNGLEINTTATSNLGLGTGAVDSITTGDYNVGVGDNALTAVTEGNYNTASGYQSMQNNTTGANNTASGYNSLYSNTTGANNTASGYSALYSNTTASYNTALGRSALYSNTTGHSNTAVGATALDACTTGSYNAAMGIAAATNITTGDQNTACGRSALQETTTGNKNTAIGNDAGGVLTTGNFNCFLGHESGVSGSPGGAITTADDNVCVGSNEITAAHVQVDWTIASDKRDKTDVEPVKMGLEFINQLEPVTYRWDKRAKYIDKLDPTVDLNKVTTDGTHKESWLDVGFLAQDVEELEAQYGYKIEDETNLTTNLSEDGKQYGLTYNKFTPMLVKAIQELSAENKALLTRIEALEDNA